MTATITTAESSVRDDVRVRAHRGDAAQRALDVALVLLAAPVVLPLCLALALLVRLDSRGPALFRQERLGRGMETFTVFKFRTMYPDAPSDPHRRYIEALAAGADAPQPGGLKKLVDDPRVTRAGRVLRRLSLDELPQLLNVLLGQMSLVGPRPALEYELGSYRPHHFERFSVRPGLTGLWQVSGRSRLGFNEMLELDVRYAREAGLGTDLRILARTPAAIWGRAA